MSCCECQGEAGPGGQGYEKGGGWTEWRRILVGGESWGVPGKKVLLEMSPYVIQIHLQGNDSVYFIESRKL